MHMELSAMEARVLGGLIEKEINTPEYYPLSLNALMAACNQKSSREPVMELSEEEVRSSLRHLEDIGHTSTVKRICWCPSCRLWFVGLPQACRPRASV